MKKINVFVLLFLVVFFASEGLSAVPPKINYEGRLTDAAGNALSGSYNMRFTITSDLAGNNVVWGPETHTGITVTNGVFATLLGDTIPVTTNEVSSPDRYLKIEVANPPTSSNYEVLTPHSQIVSVAYALKSALAQDVEGGYVSRIIAGSNVTVSPTSGKGVVTVNATGGGTTQEVKYDDLTIGLNANSSLEVKDAGITTPKITNNAVTTVKITDEAVTEPKLAVSNLPSGSRYLHWSGTAMEWAVVTSAGTSEPDNTTIGLNVNGSLEVIPNAVVFSLATVEGARIKGNVDLKPGTNVTLTQAGQTIEIASNNNAASGWIGGGGRVTLETISDQVGIGTAEPAARLDVNGNIQISAGNYLKYNGVNLAYSNTARNNYFFGNAGNSTMTGLRNSASGYRSLYLNTTGNNNSAFGMEALRDNDSGSDNVAIGYGTLAANTSGLQNTVNGASALSSNTAGDNNVAIGYGTLAANTTASGSTAIGFQAGYVSVGAYNVFLGYEADTLTTEASSVNAIAIGKNAKVGGSNMMVLGGTGVDAVKVGIGTSTPAERLTVVGTIEITSGSGGGVKFADGTIQTTAAGAGNFVRLTGDTMTGPLTIEGVANPLTATGSFDTTPMIISLTNTGVNLSDPLAAAILLSNGTDGFGMGILNTSASPLAGGGFFQADKSLNFAASSSEGINFGEITNTGPNFTMRLLNGNLGIGSWEPSSRLTVAGTIETTGGGVKFADGTTQTTAAGVDSFVRKIGDTMTGTLTFESLGPQLNITGSSDATGFGINISNRGAGGDMGPLASYLFMDNGPDTLGMGLLNQATNGIGILTSSRHLIISASSAEGEGIDFGYSTNDYPVSRMTLALNTGNLGIGSAEPASRLTVAGTIETTGGGVKFSDGTTQTTAYTGGSIAGGWIKSSGRVTLEVFSDLVGIGTPEPQAKLDIAADGNNNQGIFIRNYNPGVNASTQVRLRNDADQVIALFNNSSNYGVTMGQNAGGLVSESDKDLLLASMGTGDIRFANNLSGYSLVIKGDGTTEGFVGIGTTEPQASLHVAGNLKVTGTIEGASPVKVGGGLQVNGGNAVFNNKVAIGNSVMADPPITLLIRSGSEITDESHSLVVTHMGWFDPAPQLAIKKIGDNAGNVGMGTSEPNSKLTVAGTIETTLGGIIFPDTSIQTTAYTGSSIAGGWIKSGNKVTLETDSDLVGMGIDPYDGRYKLVVHHGTDINATLGHGFDIPSGVALTAVEDTFTTHEALEFRASKYYFAPTGFVGIGTTEPSVNLDMVGEARLHTGSNRNFYMRNGIDVPDAVSFTTVDDGSLNVPMEFRGGKYYFFPGYGNGTVGINVVTPEASLHINRDGYNFEGIRVDNLYDNSPGNNVARAGIVMNTDAAAGEISVTSARYNWPESWANSLLLNSGGRINDSGSRPGKNIILWAASSEGNVMFYTGATRDYLRMIVAANGNVGIGTSESLSSLLTVAGTIETTLGGVKFPDGTIQTTAVNSTVAGGWIKSSGQVTLETFSDLVGIGTPEPTYKLHVIGETRIGAYPDQNLDIRKGKDIAEGVSLNAVNDADLNNLPLEFRGNKYYFFSPSAYGNKVLIGTTEGTTEAYQFQVETDANDPIGIALRNINSGDNAAAELKLYNDQGDVGGVTALSSGWDGGGQGLTWGANSTALFSLPGHNLIISANGGDQIRMTTNMLNPTSHLIIAGAGPTLGYVGVGTNEPGSKLTVAGTIETTGVGGVKFPDGTIQTSASGAGLWVPNGNKIHNTNSGNVGIAASDPVATLEVGGSILSQGTAGGTPVSGMGTRFMWIPAKAALRAGEVINTEWDDAFIGNHSVAFGDSNQAVGDHSFAMGTGSTATGESSVAIGRSNSAQGAQSIAMGDGAMALGDTSVALGRQTVASGEISVAIGSGARADANRSVAIGDNVNATRPFSLAVGFGGTQPILFASGEATGGAVGIGTDEPQAKLDLAGDIRVSGKVVYTPSSVQDIAAGTGITADMLNKKIIRVQSNGGAISVEATQIAAGTDGQVIILQGIDDTNTVKFNSSGGLALAGGQPFTLGRGDIIELLFDVSASKWYEVSRSDN